MKFRPLIIFAALFVLPYLVTVYAENESVTDNDAMITQKAERIRTETMKRKTPQEIEAYKERLRTEKEAMRAEILAKTAAIKTEIRARLVNIHDEAKLRIMEQVENSLANINTRRSEHFNRVLERLNIILEKIRSRTAALAADGSSTSEVNAAIDKAQLAIDQAQDAVNAQMEKDYQLEVVSEDSARNDVGLAHKNLQEDLRTVWQKVLVAKTAVHDAFLTLKNVVKLKISPITSPTPATVSAVIN